MAPCTGWKNKVGTGNRSCICGSWKNHWIKFSGKAWPSKCSIANCSNSPTIGAHVYHSNVSGEKIVPMCDSCNKLSGEFTLRNGTTLVPANQSETCGKS